MASSRGRRPRAAPRLDRKKLAASIRRLLAGVPKGAARAVLDSVRASLGTRPARAKPAPAPPPAPDPPPGTVTEADVEEYVNTVLDYFGDDEAFGAAVLSLPEDQVELFYDCVVERVRALVAEMVGQEFPSEQAKHEAIRAKLDALRDEIAKDPVEFIRECLRCRRQRPL